LAQTTLRATSAAISHICAQHAYNAPKIVPNWRRGWPSHEQNCSALGWYI